MAGVSRGWPQRGIFAPAIEATDELIVPSICLLEVFRRVCQQRGEGAALQVVALMQQGRVVDLDSALALVAGKIGLDAKLALADSVVLATARQVDATLWTQDADLQGLPDVKVRAKKSRPKAG